MDISKITTFVKKVNIPKEEMLESFKKQIASSKLNPQTMKDSFERSYRASKHGLHPIDRMITIISKLGIEGCKNGYEKCVKNVKPIV